MKQLEEKRLIVETRQNKLFISSPDVGIVSIPLIDLLKYEGELANIKFTGEILSDTQIANPVHPNKIKKDKLRFHTELIDLLFEAQLSVPEFLKLVNNPDFWIGKRKNENIKRF